MQGLGFRVLRFSGVRVKGLEFMVLRQLDAIPTETPYPKRGHHTTLYWEPLKGVQGGTKGLVVRL